MPEITLDRILELIEAIWSTCQALKDDMDHVKDAVSDLVESCFDEGLSTASGRSWASTKSAGFSDEDSDAMLDEEKDES